MRIEITCWSYHSFHPGHEGMSLMMERPNWLELWRNNHDDVEKNHMGETLYDSSSTRWSFSGHFFERMASMSNKQILFVVVQTMVTATDVF